MSGETNLAQLLKTMEPVLDERVYVFVVHKNEIVPLASEVIGFFREEEGITLMIEKRYADARGWSYQATWKRIVMTVHSSLEAVGFLAVLSKCLADHEISVNAVSAYYHDHLFVPEEKAEEALFLLKHIAHEP